VIVMPVVFVSDMQSSVRFYELLGLKVDTKGRSGAWTELRAGDALVALHAAERVEQPATATGAGRVELAFVATELLEAVEARLLTAGASYVQRISDESFGRSLIVRDPDGLPIQINEHDVELYT
jgi:catechol 2,3-dioxygenase-like lactoylglutathione lyase family enzyme